jgi:hypothetical protein
MDTEPLEEPQYTLTANDRCDSCSAQAYVQVFLIEGSLLFCAHHFTKNEDVLTRKAIKVVDESNRLYPDGIKPEPELEEVSVESRS